MSTTSTVHRDNSYAASDRVRLPVGSVASCFRVVMDGTPAHRWGQQTGDSIFESPVVTAERWYAARESNPQPAD
jgi:hypothetical protein